MSNEETKPELGTVPSTPTPEKKEVEMEVDQTVRHGAGQPLGPKETLSDEERKRLAPTQPNVEKP